MRKFKLFNGFVLGLVCLLIVAGCESKVLIATPVANAGPDQNVARSDTVNLDGSGSTDPNADPLTYLWTMDPLTGKPAGSTAVLSDVTAVAPTFVADLDGTYTITLVVSDGATNSGVDTVVISVANTAPVANAGAPQTQAKNTLVTLNGSGSFDANLSDILTYNWTFTSVPTIAGGDPEDSAVTDASLNDNNSTTAVGPAFTADAEGDYVLELQVTDGTAFSNVAIVVITVTNTPPTAVVNVPASVHTGTLANLDGTGTSNPDVDGDALATYTWAIDSRPGGAGFAAIVNSGNPSASFTPDAVGDYTISLVVNDGFVDSTPAVVTLTSANQDPTVTFGPALTSHIGADVLLVGTGAVDNDGDALSYLWTASAAGGGTFSFDFDNIQNPTITTGGAADIFTITLTVSDQFVNSVPVSNSITLTTLVNNPPVADASATVTPVSKSNTVPVTLDGNNSSDPENDILTYSWSFTSVPTVAGGAAFDSSVTNASLSDNDSTTAVYPTFFADVSGDYVLDLIVYDGDPINPTTLSNTTTVTITVTNDPPVADAGVDLIVAIGTAAILNGGASSDPNGDALTYAWTFASVPTTPVASAITDADLSSTSAFDPNFAPDVIGDYTLSLVVTDNEAVSSLVANEVVVSAIIPVVDTGQTGSGYTSTFGEDADYGSIYQPSYTVNTGLLADTVTDNWTGLLWREQIGDAPIADWTSAQAVCDVYNIAVFATYADWRVPTRHELSSIINYGNSAPAVLGVFQSIPNSAAQYWTSDSLASDGNQGWYVDFDTGGVNPELKTGVNLVKCVRGSVASGGFTPSTVGTDNIVTDGTTSLVWQQQGTSSMEDWETALTNCEGLDFAGAQDWRLPNARELASITDVTTSNPAVYSDFNGFGNLYWTSTSNVAASANAWVVNFNDGEIETLDKTIAGGLTRCVRGGQ